MRRRAAADHPHRLGHDDGDKGGDNHDAKVDARRAPGHPRAVAPRRGVVSWGLQWFTWRGRARGDVTALHPSLGVLWVFCLVACARWSVLRVPPPLAEDADPRVFSEGRAMRHVFALADDIGVRVVGSSNLDRAEAYVMEQARALVRLAKKTRADHLDVDFIAHRATGSFRQTFLNHDITNAYTNLTNLAVRVAPKGLKGDAVLLNAHFDTTLGSPGAADCASCVGILLEVLRVLIETAPTVSKNLGAPVVFLFNGGEESFMQAAHGFVAHHPWAPSVGAVINVEATGSGGPDVLFREAGGWPAEVYMTSTPHPTTTATVRDLVRFANLPVDTDFSVFTDPREPHGNLPGVDVASMLDGYSYHTDKDVATRVRRGTVQAYGENVLAATLAFAKELPRQTLSQTAAVDREPVAAGTGAGIFDVFRVVGVVIAPRVATMSLLFLPSVMCTLDILAGGAARVAATWRGARVVAASWVAAAALPASMGASRALLLGRPLVWFGKPFVTVALYVPPAVVAFLVPYRRDGRKTKLKEADAARGAAAVTAITAAVAGVMGAAGGYLAALWSIGILAAVHLGSGVGVVLACTAPAAALSAPVAYITFVLLTEKVGIAGSEPWPLGLPIGDAIMGAATGALVAMCAAGLAPFVNLGGQRARARNECTGPGRSVRTFTRRAVLLVVVAWVAVAVVTAALYPTPYSPHTPKRLAVMHQHDANHENATTDAPMTTFVVGAFDSVPAVTALPTLHRAAVLRPTTREDFGAFHPVTTLLGEGVVLPARPAAYPPWVRDSAHARERKTKESTAPPALSASVLQRTGQTDEGDEGDTGATVVRVGVVFDTRAPAWSCARVVSSLGPVKSWSLSADPPSAGAKGAALWARHAGNGQASTVWRFWVEVAAGHEAGLSVDAWALFPGMSDEIEDVVGGMENHVSAIVGTTYRAKTARL